MSLQIQRLPQDLRARYALEKDKLDAKKNRCIQTRPRPVLNGTGAGTWGLGTRDRKIGFRGSARNLATGQASARGDFRRALFGAREREDEGRSRGRVGEVESESGRDRGRRPWLSSIPLWGPGCSPDNAALFHDA